MERFTYQVVHRGTVYNSKSCKQLSNYKRSVTYLQYLLVIDGDVIEKWLLTWKEIQ